jgi:hypothetical protein
LGFGQAEDVGFSFCFRRWWKKGPERIIGWRGWSLRPGRRGPGRRAGDIRFHLYGDGVGPVNRRSHAYGLGWDGDLSAAGGIVIVAIGDGRGGLEASVNDIGT